MIYLELFLTFAKIGAVIFGGGYAMISLIQQEMIGHGWLTATEFLNLVALAQMTPGPLALNTATYTGKIIAGVPGALAASFGIAFPSLIITSLAALGFSKIQNSPRFQGAIKGIRAAAVGLIFTAVLFFAKGSLVEGAPEGSSYSIIPSWTGITIFLIILVLNKVTKITPAWSIVLALVLGIASYFLPSGLF